MIHLRKLWSSLWVFGKKKQEMCDKYHSNKELMSNQTICSFCRQWRNHKSQLKVLKLPQGDFLKKIVWLMRFLDCATQTSQSSWSVRQARQLGWGRRTEGEAWKEPSASFSTGMASSMVALFQARYKALCLHNQNRTEKWIRRRKSIATSIFERQNKYTSHYSIQTTGKKAFKLQGKKGENFRISIPITNIIIHHKANAQHFSIKSCRKRENKIKLVGKIQHE